MGIERDSTRDGGRIRMSNRHRSASRMMSPNYHWVQRHRDYVAELASGYSERHARPIRKTGKRSLPTICWSMRTQVAIRAGYSIVPHP